MDVKKKLLPEKTGGVFLWTLSGNSTAANHVRGIGKEKRLLIGRLSMLNQENDYTFNDSGGDSEDMRGVPSSGRESYVFQANKPEGLLGVHADLMEKALHRDEGLLYLLYAPIWSEKKGPFGLYATPASHAVAVSKSRFIISENRHTEGIAPTVQSIPFSHILYIQLGSALSVGWFSVESVVDNKPSRITLFFTGTGMKHFGIAVRKYRSITGLACDQMPADAIDWADIWQHTPKTEVDHLKALILRDELPFNMVRSSERWILRKRRWKSIPVCLSTNGILLSTNFGFIYATEEPAIRPDIYSFGINVSCIPFDALRSAQVIEKRMHGRLFHFFRLKIVRKSVTVDFDIPFAGDSPKEAEDLLSFLIFKTKT